jgi:hypothetical protein
MPLFECYFYRVFGGYISKQDLYLLFNKALITNTKKKYFRYLGKNA